MKFSKKKLKIKFLFLICLILSSNCLQKNEKQYLYWKDFYSLQYSIKNATQNVNQLMALTGSLSKEREKDLKIDTSGNFYIDLAGDRLNGNWQTSLYPAHPGNHDYYSLVTFSPSMWDEKEVYIIKRETKSNWNGFMPRDFFAWLNQFAQLVPQHEKFLAHKNSTPSFRFLCETFTCQTIEESKYILLEFAFSDMTEEKFPSFYERMGSRLEKTQLEIKIYDQNYPEDLIIFSNNGKTLQFRFPSSPRKDIFKNPKTIFFQTNITIKSYGVTFQLQDLLYRIRYQAIQNKDHIEGRFVSFKSRKFKGNFLYFIPTGIVDFFIPGNIDEYLNDALTLLIHGTQGNGGSHFQATYIKNGKSQINILQTYAESLRNRFSLFGADSNQIENPDKDFFSNWENHLLKDLKSN